MYHPGVVRDGACDPDEEEEDDDDETDEADELADELADDDDNPRKEYSLRPNNIRLDDAEDVDATADDDDDDDAVADTILSLTVKFPCSGNTP